MKEKLSDLERLAIADAFIKACKKVEKGIREDVDNEMRDAFINEGVDRKQVSVNGQKVGTLSVRMTKAVEGKFPMVDNAEEFAQWVRTSDGGMDTIRRLIAVKPDLMLEAATADGELPDGCVLVERCEPPKYAGTTLRVQLPKVVDALGPKLGETATAVLTGEVE